MICKCGTISIRLWFGYRHPWILKIPGEKKEHNKNQIVMSEIIFGKS